MNRRHFLKSVAVGAGLVAMPSLSNGGPVDLTPVSPSRLERYKRYENSVLDFGVMDQRLWDIGQRITRVIGEDDPLLPKQGVARIGLGLALYGDYFVELYRTPEQRCGFGWRASHTMFRIQTFTGKLVEFQQSLDGPDYKAVVSQPIDGYKGGCVRFHPWEIVSRRRPSIKRGSIHTASPCWSATTRKTSSNNCTRVFAP